MGRITTTAYDNRGWVATVTDPLGNVTTYWYTATGKDVDREQPEQRRRVGRSRTSTTRTTG